MGRLLDMEQIITIAKNMYPNEDVRKICWLLCHTPTAYDVEKVVAELKERKGNVIIDGKIMYQENYFIDIDSAIDIVKAGGVDGKI